MSHPESPIAHPTEVGHMRNIAAKLVGIELRMRKGREAWATGQRGSRDIH